MSAKVKIVSDSFADAVREVDRLRAINAELLAALEKVERVYGRDFSKPIPHGIWPATRAAIAKAKGETP